MIGGGPTHAVPKSTTTKHNKSGSNKLTNKSNQGALMSHADEAAAVSNNPYQNQLV